MSYILMGIDESIEFYKWASRRCNCTMLQAIEKTDNDEKLLNELWDEYRYSLRQQELDLFPRKEKTK